jgi:hypothetical protein
MGRLNSKGVKVHRCNIKVTRKSQKIGEVCTGNKHCSKGLKCDKDRFMCYDKAEGHPSTAPSRRSGRSADSAHKSEAMVHGTRTNGMFLVLAVLALASVGTMYMMTRGPTERVEIVAVSRSTDTSVVTLFQSIEISEDEPAMYNMML